MAEEISRREFKIDWQATAKFSTKETKLKKQVCSPLCNLKEEEVKTKKMKQEQRIDTERLTK